MLQVAAQLYQIQGRYDLALAIFLHQQQPAVFDFIQEHHLLPVLHERVAQLLSIDEERAVALLMQEYDQIPASTVVSSIQVSNVDICRQSMDSTLVTCLQKQHCCTTRGWENTRGKGRTPSVTSTTVCSIVSMCIKQLQHIGAYNFFPTKSAVLPHKASYKL